MIQAAAELCLYDGQVAMRTRERERNSALDCARQSVCVCASASVCLR